MSGESPNNKIILLFATCLLAAATLAHAGLCIGKPKVLASDIEEDVRLERAGQAASELNRRQEEPTSRPKEETSTRGNNDDDERQGELIEIEPSEFATADDEQTHDPKHVYPDEDKMRVYAGLKELANDRH